MQDTLLFLVKETHIDALQRILEPHYQILTASDFAQAASILSGTVPRIAAVLADSDFVRPLCGLVSTSYTGLPVIAVAQQPDSETQLLEMGAAEIIDPPFRAPILLHRLRNIISLSRQAASSADGETLNHAVQEGLRLSLERHQIVMAQTNDIIFELDFETDTLLCSPKWEERFGYPHIVHQASTQILRNSHIHPDHIDQLRRNLEELRSGTRYLEMEIQISNAAGQYTWSRLRATAQQDSEGRTIKLVGVIIDIEQEKRISQALLDEAARDPLTKLYNRNASRRKIDSYLAARSASEQAALLIIDLDNFKEVNDRYGHMYGDAILLRASAEISGFFRSNDIISRIGGDEFMIFMKNIPGRTLVEKRCRELISSIRHLHHEQSGEFSLSCSIGVALIPEHGISYQDLFQRADRALYSAKTQDKGCFMFYDLENSTPFPYPAPAAKSGNEEPASTSDAHLIRYVFDRFCESGDVESSIRSVLELAGRQVNASRAYIFENDPENRFCTNTYEWCNRDISPQIHNLQRIDYSDGLSGYPDLFNERGIFYCPDTDALPEPLRTMLAKQNIKSLLQCSIRDNGVFRGFVGFDECVSPRLWTQDQIDLLTLLSQILSLFLLKNRAQTPSIDAGSHPSN